MSLPYFFADTINDNEQTLDEETSKHVVQVLRMNEEDHLLLTDGKGTVGEAEIINAHKKHCEIRIISKDFSPRPTQQLTIGISLIKNTSRFEWFLEKAVELGTAEIVPLLCSRTEKQKFRNERLMNILKSAMLQSRQTWLAILHEPTAFNEFITRASHDQRFIAHCAEDEKQSLFLAYDNFFSAHLIMIGPEGDFTTDEIQSAKKNGFIPVSLGSTRLRTETAGIYAAVVGAQ